MMNGLPDSGQLSDTPFAEAAGALFREKKSGALTLSSGERSRTVHFYEGNPVAVSSADPRDHVARILAAKGKISPQDAEGLQKLPETKEGLQSADFVAKDVLTWGLKFRFVNLCYDLFRWDEGTYSFAEGPPPRDLFLMKVPTPTLVGKGVKHVTPSFLMERLPSDHLIAPGPLDSAAAGTLGEEETTLLGECREGRTVAEVLDSGVVEATRVREILYLFLSLGLVSLQTPAAEEEIGFEAMPVAPMEDIEVGAVEAPAIEEPPFDAPPAEAPAIEEPPFEAPLAEMPAAEAPPVEEEPAFEIERHSYEEPAAAPDPALSMDAAEEPAPPPLEDSPGIPDSPDLISPEPSPPETPSPIGLEKSGAPEEAGELEPPGLDMPPPMDQPAEEADGGEPGGLEPAGFDTPPAPSPDFPPPPWQGEAESEEEGGGDGAPEAEGGGMSPFASPDTPPPPPAGRAASRAKKADKSRRSFSFPLRPLIIVALIAAAAVVGVGLFKGSRTIKSPSTPLPPIPPAEDVVPMADDLPVPDIRKLTGKKPPAPPAPATKAAPATKKAAAAGSASLYETGLKEFREGRYEKASATWRSMLRDSGAAYTVQIVVACQVDTVQNAFTNYGRERGVFTVPLQLKGRTCFRVCFGSFPTKAAAQAAIDALPIQLSRDLQIKAAGGL